MVSPATLSLLTTTFPEGPARNRALGSWGAVAAGGGAAGLLLGGLLTELISWRWCFLINVPIAAAALVAAPRLLPEERRTGQTGLDAGGAALATGGVGRAGVRPQPGREEGFTDPLAAASLAAAVVALGLFVAWERRVARPLMPLQIFRNRTLSGANLATSASSAVIAGLSFFGTLYLEQTLGLSPIQTGLAFLPMTLTIMALSAVVAKTVDRTGPQPLLVAGGLLLAGGVGYLTQINVGGTYIVDVLPGLLLAGAGLGLSFTAGTLAATAGVSGDQQGLASGLVNTSQQIGQAVGLAVLATVASAATRASPGPPAQALVAGWTLAFLVRAAFGLLAALAARVLIERRVPPAGEHTHIATSGQTSGCLPAVNAAARVHTQPPPTPSTTP